MNENKKLIELFNESKNRSIKWEKYFSIYEKLFNDYKNKGITFVEIGILDGGSLEIWKKYFGDNSRIIGISEDGELEILSIHDIMNITDLEKIDWEFHTN